MKLKNVSLTKRKILIVLAVILTIILLLLFAAFLYIHSFIHKMNLVTSSDYDNMKTAPTSISEPAPYTAGSNPEPEAESAQDISVEKDTTEAADTGNPKIDDEKDAKTSDTPVSEVEILESKIKNNIDEKQIPIKYDKEVFNILLIGSDSRESGGHGRSDAMILVSINKHTKTIIVTSILRDIYLQIPGQEQNNRINTAYAYGGAGLLMDTVEQNFKIKVDKYASIDFYAFIDIIDAIGGVTLGVTEEDIPVINNYVKELNKLTGMEENIDCLVNPGTLLLNGKQALGYSRNRYVGNADFERTARQREVLRQIYDKMKSLELSKMKDLLNHVLPMITTNLTEGEIFSKILSLPSYMNYDVEQWSIPKAGSYSAMNIRGMAVLGIDFELNIKELQSNIYGEKAD